jgi:spore coat polysaccharide biosynthesis protein SpsF
MHTPQEQAWAGEWGNRYTDRNMGRVPANRYFFKKVLDKIPNPRTILELGCGAGENLQALHQLLPAAELEGVEINHKAVEIARGWNLGTIHECSLLNFTSNVKWELVFTKGVLIHVPPTELNRAYKTLVESANRWVMVAEYYSPQPVEIPYRGQHSLLWKRDFAGELLTMYPELKLVDYGFVYHRDPYPQDDLHWWIMEKRA